MGKKPVPEAEPRRTSTRPIKKKKRNSDQEEFFEEEEEEGAPSQKAEKISDGEYSDSDGDEEESEEESEEIPVENLAVRNMQFRQRRGTKMNYLISRKKEEEEDPFWAQQGQNYFGDLDDGDNDEEDYVQSSSGRDEFDSDFNQTESQHEIEEPAEQKQLDEDEQKEKKRRQQLMRKIHAPAPAPRKAIVKTAANSSTKKVSLSDAQKKISEPSSRYIHQVFNQEQLLGEAATTEYFNWLSLKKLISLQTEKKDFARREHHLEGPKVIYRNRFNADGQRESTFELQQVQVKEIEDLTKYMRS